MVLHWLWVFLVALFAYGVLLWIGLPWILCAIVFLLILLGGKGL